MTQNHTHYTQDHTGSILTRFTAGHVENNQTPRSDLLLRRKRVARERMINFVFVFIQVKSPNLPNPISCMHSSRRDERFRYKDRTIRRKDEKVTRVLTQRVIMTTRTNPLHPRQQRNQCRRSPWSRIIPTIPKTILGQYWLISPRVTRRSFKPIALIFCFGESV